MEHFTRMNQRKQPKSTALPDSAYLGNNAQSKKQTRKGFLIGVAAVCAIALLITVTAVIISFGKKKNDYTGTELTASDSKDESEVSSYVQAEVVPLEECGNIKPGLHISFGNYKQGEEGEVQPVEWRVLSVQDGKALVISERLLDYMPYHNTDEDVTWETCSLRKWLNKDFLNEAFSAGERKKIAKVTISNPKNPEYLTKGGKDTEDKIFLLSLDEAKEYFSTDEERMAYTTDYAHRNGYDGKYRVDYWWLRSPGKSGNTAAGIRDLGIILYHGQNADSSGVAIRPALWLNI